MRVGLSAPWPSPDFSAKSAFLVRPASVTAPSATARQTVPKGRPGAAVWCAPGQAATSPIALESQRLREVSASGPQPIDGQDVDSIVGDVAPAAEVKDEPSGEG